MPGASTSLATLRPELGTFFQFDPEMDRNGFIGNRVFPVLEVQKQSGAFGKITLANLLATRNTKRATGSAYSRQGWEFDDASFACEEHGAEEVVDDREAQMYSDYFDAEVISLMRSRDVVLRNYETRIADAVFNTTTWTGASLFTSVGTEWSTTSSTPITNVEAAVQKVYDNSGLWANALVITKKVFRNLRLVTQITDTIAASGAGSGIKASEITAQMLAMCFDLDYVLVAGGTKNTANEGATATPAPIWDDEYAMVCRIATTADMREPCIGRTFHWGQDGSSIGGTVETYRDETVRGNVVRCRMDTDEVVLYAQAGHLLGNITA